MISELDPNSRFRRYLEQGTQELRTFVSQNIISDNPREIDRVTRYYLFWNYYEGRHYKDFNDAMVSFNYVKAFIDKVNLFLLGDTGFTFKVTSYDNDVVDVEIEKAVEKLLLRNWRKNNHTILAQELLQMGSICGDAWVGVNWWTDKKCCKITVFDSRQCFPKFKNGDIDQLESFVVRQTMQKNDKNYIVRVTKYTKVVIETWYQVSASENLDKNADRREYKIEPNPMGEIPIVHIKNRPLSSGYYGQSDAHDILKLNKVYNELNQEIKSIIDYYATPTTVVTGASVKTLKRGLGNIWSGLPPEANVFNLGLDVDLSSVTTYIEKLKTSMHEISDVPEGVLGKIQAISGTSAAALKLTYQPLLQQANLKALTYGEGITQINELILKHYQRYAPDSPYLEGLPEEFHEDYRCEPIFAYGFPSDRMNMLQEAQYEFQMGIASKKEVMNRLGKNNVPDLINEITQEKITDATLNNQIAVMTQNIAPQQPTDTGQEDLQQ